MKAFYGSKISEHMTKTPEGFLICHSVPICRTGIQQYLPGEMGEAGSGMLDVERREDEVFKAAAIASYEGKPVCDDHPPGDVNAANWAAYTKGTVQNVRRGTGEDSDKIVCDLVVYDAALIAKIEAGKREISCGYDCKYINDGDGKYHQADIIGNHVAVVDNGRAGHSVSIRDSMPEGKGGKKMAEKKSILQRMFAAFSKDAEPEEIREAARAVDEAEGCAPEKEEPQLTRDEDMEVVMQAIKELDDKVNALIKTDKEVHASMDEDMEKEPEEKPDALDALEGELAKKCGQDEAPAEEESVTISPEEIEAQESKDAEEDVEAAAELDPKKAADSAAALAVIRAMKPIIATMPPEQRKRAADAMNRELKKALRTTDSQPLNGEYGALTRRNTADTLAKQADARAFGENCRKFNPHYKAKEEK